MASQVGQSFNGVEFTAEEYARIESAYVAAALAFLREGGVTEMCVAGLEDSRQVSRLFEGQTLGTDTLEPAMRSILREEFWCRFESESAFVHFGWDYYMYVGIPCACTAAREAVEKLGLFVEEFRSPYRADGAS